MISSRQNILILVSIIALCSILGCGGRSPQAAAAEIARPLTVAVAKVERRDLTRTGELSAEFRPYQEVAVHAKIAGYLKEINVDVGDRVKEGQLIALLEVPEYAEELAHASAAEKRSQLDVARSAGEVQRAQAAYELRKLSFERLKAASDARPNLIARQELDTAAGNLHEAEAQLATAKAALASTEQQVNVNAAGSARVRTMLTYLRISAPFSGVVTKRYADRGAMIQAGTASHTQATPVVRIAQVDRLRLVLPVPESMTPRVRIGREVEVRVDSLQRIFEGTVARFSGQLNPSTRTMETEVDVPNTTDAILPGMYGSVTLALDTRTGTLTAPVQALAHGSRPTVMVVNGSELEERPVRLGLETPNRVEILSGVREGELVVIGSRAGLKSGRRVEVKVLSAASLEGGE